MMIQRRDRKRWICFVSRKCKFLLVLEALDKLKLEKSVADSVFKLKPFVARTKNFDGLLSDVQVVLKALISCPRILNIRFLRLR